MYRNKLNLNREVLKSSKTQLPTDFLNQRQKNNNVRQGKENFGLRSAIHQQHRLKIKKRHHFTEESRESKRWLFKWSWQTINVYTVDKKLIPASDKQGVLCAYGRLENIGSLPDEMHNPIILPRSLINTLEKTLQKANTMQLQKSHRWIKQAFLDRGCAKYGQTSNW